MRVRCWAWATSHQLQRILYSPELLKMMFGTPFSLIYCFCSGKYYLEKPVCRHSGSMRILEGRQRSRSVLCALYVLEFNHALRFTSPNCKQMTSAAPLWKGLQGYSTSSRLVHHDQNSSNKNSVMETREDPLFWWGKKRIWSLLLHLYNFLLKYVCCHLCIISFSSSSSVLNCYVF